MSNKGQKFQKYDLEFKQKVLAEYKEGYSASYLAKKSGIPSNTVSTWKTIEAKYGGLGIAKKGRPLEEQDKDYKERYEILKKFQDFLAKQGQKKK